MKRTVATVAVALLVPGCGSGGLGLVDFCNQQYQLQCPRWFGCQTPNVQQTFGSEAGCENFYAGVCKTSTECQEGYIYHPDVASQCLAAYASQSCAEVNQSVTPAACQGVCTPP